MNTGGKEKGLRSVKTVGRRDYGGRAYDGAGDGGGAEVDVNRGPQTVGWIDVHEHEFNEINGGKAGGKRLAGAGGGTLEGTAGAVREGGFVRGGLLVIEEGALSESGEGSAEENEEKYERIHITWFRALRVPSD